MQRVNTAIHIFDTMRYTQIVTNAGSCLIYVAVAANICHLEIECDLMFFCLIEKLVLFFYVIKMNKTYCHQKIVFEFYGLTIGKSKEQVSNVILIG